MTLKVVSNECSVEKSSKNVLKRHLADRANQLNFHGKAVVVQFTHPRYGHTVTATADPLPCSGENLEICWRDGLPENASQYTVTSIILPGDPNTFTFPVDNPEFTVDGMFCLLPNQGTALPERKHTRLPALGKIKATLSQHGIRIEGFLTDFSAHSLCVGSRARNYNNHWISTERLVHLTLENDQDVIFSGDMEVIRNEAGQDNQSYVLAPAVKNTPRFATKRYRSNRISLFPEPSLVFRHPLTGRRIELNVTDLSGMGLCVEVFQGKPMLVSGMILPEMHITLGAGFAIPCRGQVVYQNEPIDDSNAVRCGIALLDIDLKDHLRLLSHLQRARNRNAYLSAEVDIESLWEFFFETGFIYPSKYQQLAQRKEGFLETLRKTYLEQTSIARHFTFQAEGQIMAHLSAVRLYEKTWFQQHHAARRSGKRAVGFEVFKQLAEYFYNVFPLSNDKVGYIASISRPENRFPARYNREIIKQLNNKKAASLDLFAYFVSIPEYSDNWSWAEIPPAWAMSRTTHGDLVEFNGFYEKVSGGCMVDALDMRPEQLGLTVLEEEYRKLGMTRRRHLYSIKRDQELMAIIDLHESDTDLSLSRTDQAIICSVLREELPPTLLSILTQSLAGKMNLDKPPMMIFPRDYTTRHGIKQDKDYEMLILNMLHVEEYMIFMDHFIESHSPLS